MAVTVTTAGDSLCDSDRDQTQARQRDLIMIGETIQVIDSQLEKRDLVCTQALGIQVQSSTDGSRWAAPADGC